jgi:hypothetical protein
MSDLKNCLLLCLASFALAGLLDWMNGHKPSLGPLGDERPLAPLVEHCWALSRERPPKIPNYATPEDCDKLLTVRVERD